MFWRSMESGGITILAVLGTHAAFLGGAGIFGPERWWIFPSAVSKWIFLVTAFGWWGVDLFFVLSGFLITSILLATRDADNRVISFYARRFLRIFPLYYLALIAILLAATQSSWVHSMIESGWRDRGSYFLYLQNWRFAWGSPYLRANLLGHFWSLAVEEQFYILWPLLVWLLPERAILRMCIVGAALSLGLRLILVHRFGPGIWITEMTPCRGEGLLVGSALAVLSSRGRRVPRNVLVGMAAAGLGLLALIAVIHPREFSNTDAGWMMDTLGITGLALLFGALVASTQYQIPGLTSALQSGWLRSFGKYSYGIYVYHIPIYLLEARLLRSRGVTFPLPLPYSIPLFLFLIGSSYLVAFVSFRLMEAPLLRLKRYFEPERKRTAIAA